MGSEMCIRDRININQIDHFPCVVKPNDQGSSLGVSIIRSLEELTRFVTLKSKNFEVFECADDYILEKYISGRELTTAIVDNTPLGVTEIITKDWYDYDSKYIEGRGPARKRHPRYVEFNGNDAP